MGRKPHRTANAPGELASQVYSIGFEHCRRHWASHAVCTSAGLAFHRRLSAQTQHRCGAVFCEEIYPLVRDRLPDTKFYIIGDKAPPEIVALANDRIIVAGLQRNVRSFFDSVRLSVAPLRFGAGIKGKINQSMAFGVPVVATSIAVEGMNLADHEHVLVADEPQDFAHALIELYESEEALEATLGKRH